MDLGILAQHWELFRETLSQEENFSNFNSFYRRLMTGKFLVTKNHFHLEQVTFSLDNKLKIAGMVFLPGGEWGAPGGVGCLAVAADVTESQVQNFWLALRKHYQGIQLIAPFAGHHYLGFSLPDRHPQMVPQSKDLLFEPARPQKIGVMTTALNSRVERLFRNPKITPIYRQYFSLETRMSPERIEVLQSELRQQPKNFRIRKLNRLRPRAELAIMNQLVNACFINHFDFCPLSEVENWDLMKWSLPLFQSGCFLFLMDGDKEIGFAFGMLDYNQIFEGRSDFLNFLRFCFRKGQICRGRLIHIGMLPKYRGQKLVKYLRHQLLLNLTSLGASTIESSYIDQANVASLGNVESTGAKALHKFSTYLVSGTDLEEDRPSRRLK
ncbi:MAG: hypothetical protein JNM39_12730 [Bdellovibrionaceae bacterium]|nr:hypothetical protein [Pseudobdellovibrionaceae bacterium]